MNFLRYFSWFLRALLFVLLLLFALKNTTPVRLHFFLDTGWEAPLIGLLLIFFTLGAVLGVMACLGRIFRQRREIAALKRRLEQAPSGSVKPGSSRPEALPAVPPELGL